MTEELRFDSRWRQRFLSPPQRPYQLCGPPSLLSNGYPRSPSFGVKRSGPEPNHSLPSCGQAQNALHHAYSPPHVICEWSLSKQSDNFIYRWLRHYAKSLKVLGSIPDEVIGFFNWPNPSSRTMVLGSTQPLTEMSTKNLPGGKGQPERKADNLTTVCEPII
jgi:hypothetical protein